MLRVKFIFLIICSSTAWFALGQVSTSQTFTIDQKLQDYSVKDPQEKVFIHTDKPFYFTGETIWFKAYCLDATYHTLNPMSKVLYIELLSNNNLPVEQEKVKLESGTGSGQFFINADLSSGTYKIRAYTLWMKNHDHDFFFEKTLTIINPFRSLPKELTDTAKANVLVSFFPEGGNLVNGLQSKLAIKATDSTGQNLAVKGTIMDNHDQEVTTFTTSRRGTGIILFTPETGVHYTAFVENSNGDSLRFDLPEVLQDGMVMSVIENPQDRTFEVSVNTKDKAKEQIYLLVHTRGHVGIVQSQRLIDGHTQFIFSKESIPAGISHVTLFNESLLPVCERLIFKYPDQETTLALNHNNTSYGNREKVSLTMDGTNKFEGANLSLSVYKYQSKLDTRNNSIKTDILLTSDLKGYVQEPDYFFHDIDDSVKMDLDELLLTQGWRRFEWSDVLEERPPVIQYPPEILTPILYGKINAGNIENGLKPRSVVVAFPGKSALVSSAKINDEGNFYIEVPDWLRNNNMLLWSDDLELESHNIQIISPFEKSQSSQKNHLRITKDLRGFIENNSINTQISNVYLPFTRVRGEGAAGSPIKVPFYGKPDLQYNLDDYTRFPTMDEVFIEYVKFVYKKKRNKELNFYVADMYNKGNTLEKPALMMIDGIPVRDVNFVMQFDPLKTEKIHIINRKYHAGDQEFYGIVNLITYKGDFGGHELPKYIVNKLYKGLQQTRTFFSPQYTLSETKKDRIPDYRNVLLWEPNISLTSSGQATVEFYTSDDNGKYRVEVNGISKNGDPIYETSELEVKSNNF
ncbi:hypothetical protein QQ008_03540 [Fulvivirgaceae bacterium BMA10]|uniref:Macroglobulin domain-containing protein n=1 Tax=Splendidivirga corallicola TaxID=3051826 RepID=A0ABT8KI67_9BACT|nr:hypothetical protein [Fulvivirgaceae bacterium BMA10]